MDSSSTITIIIIIIIITVDLHLPSRAVSGVSLEEMHKS